MKKKILIHSIVFSPDGVSTAYLYNDIALGLQAAGYEVVVLSTTPHYNLVAEELLHQPLQPHLFGLYSTSEFHGIKVYHVFQKKHKKAFLRIFGFIFWHIMSFFIALNQKNITFILSPSPPLSIGFVSILLAKLKGAKVAYNVQEIYPDLLINQGSLTAPFIINLLKRLERFVYQYSNAIITIDEIFHNIIKTRVTDQKKLHIIPNFVDTSLYKPIERDKNLDPKYFPITSTLKLMYAGNIGYAQDWGPLLYAAEALKGFDIEFWVIGEGVLKESLIEQIQQRGLNNIHIVPYQSRESMPAIVSYADIHFIFMNPKLEQHGFPSKAYTIMSCAKPLLVITGKSTPLYNFLHEKDCALLIDEVTDFERNLKLVSILKAQLQDRSKLNLMGRNGLQEIKKSYAKDVVIKKYTSLIAELINSK